MLDEWFYRSLPILIVATLALLGVMSRWRRRPALARLVLWGVALCVLGESGGMAFWVWGVPLAVRNNLIDPEALRNVERWASYLFLILRAAGVGLLVRASFSNRA
jgi:hypothetical protein